MIPLVVATRNAHKVREIQQILGAQVLCIPLSDLPDAPPLIEDGDTFAANATKKAVQLAEWLARRSDPEFGTHTPEARVLADDSGLEVDALNGAPGVHSARFAALDTGASGNSSEADNNIKLLRLLKDVPFERRTARFRCALALTEVIPHAARRTPQLYEGVCEGRIDCNPRGEGGFGYDPLFVPDGYQQSFAELGDETKNRLSHRSRALAKLRERLLSHGCR